jgi:hypothetical protein
MAALFEVESAMKTIVFLLMLCVGSSSATACGWAGSTRVSCTLEDQQASVAARLASAHDRRSGWSDPNYVMLQQGWWGYAADPAAVFYGHLLYGNVTTIRGDWQRKHKHRHGKRRRGKP